MSKFRLYIPYILGFLAVGGLTSYWVVDAIVAGASPLVIPIFIAVGLVGSVIGLYVTRVIRRKVIKK